MIDDPSLTAYCDGHAEDIPADDCDVEITLHMTPTSRGGWGMRSVESELKRAKWTKDGDSVFCPGCSKRRKA